MYWPDPLVAVALLVFCDCALVCALAAERPSPVRAIIANGISSRVEDLPISFCRITSPQVTQAAVTDLRNIRTPPWPLDSACSNSALGRCLLAVANIRQISEFLTMPLQPPLRAGHPGVSKILGTFTISAWQYGKGELVAGLRQQSNWGCVFPALVDGGCPSVGRVRHDKGTTSMKKLSLGIALE